MTTRDKWKDRACVLAYRAWADLLRLKAFGKNQKRLLNGPTRVRMLAFMDSGKQHRVGPHALKPDIDNCAKACLDALFVNDHLIYSLQAEKFWCDGGRARIEIEFWEEAPTPNQQRR